MEANAYFLIFNPSSLTTIQDARFALTRLRATQALDSVKTIEIPFFLKSLVHIQEEKNNLQKPLTGH